MLGFSLHDRALRAPTNYGLLLLGICARGTYGCRLFVATCATEKNSPDRQTGHTIRLWEIEGVNAPIPNLAGLSPLGPVYSQIVMPDFER